MRAVFRNINGKFIGNKTMPEIGAIIRSSEKTIFTFESDEGEGGRSSPGGAADVPVPSLANADFESLKAAAGCVDYPEAWRGRTLRVKAVVPGMAPSFAKATIAL